MLKSFLIVLAIFFVWLLGVFGFFGGPFSYFLATYKNYIWGSLPVIVLVASIYAYASGTKSRSIYGILIGITTVVMIGFVIVAVDMAFILAAH